MGPLEAMKPWSTQRRRGRHRFLDRVWRLCIDEDGALEPHARRRRAGDRRTARLLHQTIKKVTEDIEALRFNTAIAQMMVFVNELTTLRARGRARCSSRSCCCWRPFAPHLAEELWQRLGHAGIARLRAVAGLRPGARASRTRSPWRSRSTASCAATLELPRGAAQADGRRRPRWPTSASSSHLEGAAIRKVIHVPDKLLNLVVGPA